MQHLKKTAWLMALALAPVGAWAGIPVPPAPVPHPIMSPISIPPAPAPHPISVHVAKPPALTPLTPHEQFLMGKVHGFLWGKPSAHEKAVVFFDPNCIWCHRFFEQVQAGVAQGKARYLMVPVAILKKSSIPKAERILNAVHPQAAFLQDEQHFNVVNESGGLSGKPFPAPKTIQNILAINTAVLADLENGRPVTPTVLVKTSDNSMALHEGFIDG